MTEIQRLIKSRTIIATSVSVLLLLVISLLFIFSSLRGQPEGWYSITAGEDTRLREDELIRGWANLDKDSYLIGDLAHYQVRLIWRNDKITPDTETFKNGIGFFPFNRLNVSERMQALTGNETEYILQYRLQAVDVDPGQSYSLSPPTIYFTTNDNSTGELRSYRIDAPQVHIGEYYPQNVSRIPLLPLKDRIRDPAGLRSGIMALNGMILLCLAVGLLWYFGRVRQRHTLTEPERLWKEFQSIKEKKLTPREYLLKSELIFTDLLIYRLEMSPAEFWSGKRSEDKKWNEVVEKARNIFFQGYLREEPEKPLLDEITSLLDELLSQLVDEELLKMEIIPSWSARLARQPALLSMSSIIVLISVLCFVLSFIPMAWGPVEVQEYNRVIDLLNSEDLVEEKYEQIVSFADNAESERIKAVANYNAGTYSATPELVGQDRFQQQALLEVMFQEQRVFLDALLHSLGMEDPFLLVAMIRDGIRFMTQGEAALKSAVRLNPDDVTFRRNLELIQKRRNAYADTITELLQEGEESEGMGELQRQTLMDLEQFMQMEMPEEYAELEEGKDDKDYFILEGF